jgi:hypothetical protein
MYVRLINEVTMYSSLDGPQTFPVGTVMHVTPISRTMVKTRWGYLYVGDFEVTTQEHT